MRPGYTSPTRKELAGDLLNKVNEEVRNDIVDQLKNNDKVIVSQDGWENNSHDPIHAHRISTGEKSCINNIQDCGSKKRIVHIV